MGWEKRKAIRRSADRSVAILQSDGTLVRECEFVDMSDTGGRLRLQFLTARRRHK
jgi:hypothetical protein